MSKNKSQPVMGSIGAESEYTPLSTDRIKQIARDYLAGKMFGSWQLGQHEYAMLSVYFLPLIAIDELTLKQWKRDNINHFMGHIKDSVMSMNGFPIFSSMLAINTDDAERIVKMAKAMDDAINCVEEA